MPDAAITTNTSSTTAMAFEITLEQAQLLVRKLPEHDQTTVSMITEIRSKGYSFTTGTRTYIIDLIQPTESADAQKPSDIPQSSTLSESIGHKANCACFLTITCPTLSSSAFETNTLSVTHHLLNLICTKTEIPLAESILDTSLSIVPYHVLLSRTTPTTSENLISLAEARRLGLFSEKANAFVDLELGKLLGQLHTNVQNDWFGVPALEEPAMPSYSWQESFTTLFENLISFFESGHVKVDFEIPYEKIRLYHSRAIGFSLFDDVEVPSLIWLTGSEDDIFISRPTSHSDDPWSFEIRAILPDAAHAIWGDPLLESFFVPPNPTKAMAEGYIGSGGGALTIFPRQHTKRIWYDIFLALLVLYEMRELEQTQLYQERRTWCEKTILEGVGVLKDAPNY